MSIQGRTVGVVFGSRSVEHEISIITAVQAMAVLQELGARVVPLYITKSGRWLTAPQFTALEAFRPTLPEEGTPVHLDLARGRLLAAASSRLGRPRDLEVEVLLPCLHGTMGEDGTLAGLAELVSLPQAGSPTLAAALAMDKLRSKQLFQAGGLPVLPARPAESVERARQVAAELGYPLVVKPNRGGSSVGVSVVGAAPELEEAIEVALGLDSLAILEPALVGATDLNCAVKVGPPRASEVERPLKQGTVLSYSDKYLTKGALKGGPSKGSLDPKGALPDPRRELPAQIPRELRQRVQDLAVSAFDALGCRGVARVDFLLSAQGELYLNEVNTIPGSLAYYLWQASGTSYAQLLEEMVEEALAGPPPRRLALEGNLLEGPPAPGSPLA